MKKLLSLLFCTAIFFSCKKEDSKNSQNTSVVNKKLQTKINSWLEEQKPNSQPNKAANVELLKNNLDYSNLTVEKSEENEQIIVIPIKEEIKTQKKIDSKTIADLVIILSSNGTVRRGNVVLSTSLDGSAKSRVPEKTFYNIYNTSKVAWDSKFLFLSVTGKRLYELEYKNGKLYSAGIVQTKKNTSSGKGAKETEIICTDWYLVTTYYDEYGNVVGQTSEYIGQTCNDCDNSMYMSLCGDASGGGSGGSDYEYAISKPLTWVIDKDALNYYEISSKEQASGVKVASEYQGGHFTSIVHQTSYLSSNPYGTSTWEQIAATTSIDNPQLASAYVTGKVKFGPGTQVEVVFTDIHNAWAFQGTF